MAEKVRRPLAAVAVYFQEKGDRPGGPVRLDAEARFLDFPPSDDAPALLPAYGSCDQEWGAREPTTFENLQVHARLVGAAKEALCPHFAAELEQRVRFFMTFKGWNTLAVKKDLVKGLNAAARQAGLAFATPGGDGPCTLVAVGDLWGGKVALENRKTKRRSCTSRTLDGLFPFRMMPINVEVVVNLLQPKAE